MKSFIQGGIWLDRGELDKIIKRSAAPATVPAPVQVPPPQGTPRGQPGYGQQPYGHDPRYHAKRRKSFLEDLFD